jgi:hypothetical protein
MGNTIYAESLKGMSVENAKQFITENNVYFDVNNTKYKIGEIRIIYPDALYTMDYCPSRLEVKVDTDKIITEILGTG